MSPRRRRSAAALERAQRQAAHLQKMEAIGQLTGGIAHAFNNLLMIVMGHAQSLQRRLSEKRDIRALEAIQMAATRGEKSRTRQLLSFARTLPLNPTVISAAEAVHAVRDRAGRLAARQYRVQYRRPRHDLAGERRQESELRTRRWSISRVNGTRRHAGGRPDLDRGRERRVECARCAQRRGRRVRGAERRRSPDAGISTRAAVARGRAVSFFTTKGPDKGTGLGLSQVYGLAHRCGRHRADRQRGRSRHQGHDLSAAQPRPDRGAFAGRQRAISGGRPPAPSWWWKTTRT